MTFAFGFFARGSGEGRAPPGPRASCRKPDAGFLRDDARDK